MELLVTVLFFGACMSAMSIGVIVNGRRLRGSCGGVADAGSQLDDLSCGACARQDAEVCPSDDPLVQLAQIAHPDPRHHR